MVLAGEPVAGPLAYPPDRLVVVAVSGVFAPGVLGANLADGEMRLRPAMTVGAPPQFSRTKDAPRGPAIALALVGEDAAAPKRHRKSHSARRQPSLPGISRPRANPDHGERAIRQDDMVSL